MDEQPDDESESLPEEVIEKPIEPVVKEEPSHALPEEVEPDENEPLKVLA